MRANEVPWRILSTHAEYDSKWGIVKIDVEDIDKLPDAGFGVYTVKNKRWYPYPYVSLKFNTVYRILLSRYLMNCPKDKIIDIVNHNTLDLRKSNLRICFRMEDNCN